MLLSKEGVKIHEEALAKENYNKGYDKGYDKGAESRQGEIDSLNTLVQSKEAENKRLMDILKANGIDPN